jgi:tRNA dimethylallyltransferase
MQDKCVSEWVLVLIGPTAVGKTDLAIDLAKKINGEIISADSRLFYRGMDIGTAKPSFEQRRQVVHHLIDVAAPDEIWSLPVFQEKAEETIRLIQSQNKVAIIVGGTGQYIRAITEGWQIPPQQPDDRLRMIIEKWGQEIGAEELHEKLALIDPKAAEKIDAQNIRRTIRALEVIFLTGDRFSIQRSRQAPLHKFWMIGLTRPRPELYARIDARIEAMFTDGFVEETRKLLECGIPMDHPNLSAIGYREVCQYLAGTISLEEAKVQMRKRTREFVRRQTNWFKPTDPQIHWYGMDENPEQKILADLQTVGIITIE